MTHICVGKITIIDSDNGLSPCRRQSIIWTNAGILLIRPLGTNFGEILIGIQTFSFKKIDLKMSSGKCRPFCLGLNVLTHCCLDTPYGDIDLGQHLLRNCLLPDGTTQLPEPMLTYQRQGPCSNIHLIISLDILAIYHWNKPKNTYCYIKIHAWYRQFNLLNKTMI